MVTADAATGSTKRPHLVEVLRVLGLRHARRRPVHHTVGRHQRRGDGTIPAGDFLEAVVERHQRAAAEDEALDRRLRIRLSGCIH